MYCIKYALQQNTHRLFQEDTLRNAQTARNLGTLSQKRGVSNKRQSLSDETRHSLKDGMTMTITNKITFSFCLFSFFPSRLYHTVIMKKEKKTTASTLASCKKHIHWHVALGKEIKARQRIQKYRKPLIRPPASALGRGPSGPLSFSFSSCSSTKGLGTFSQRCFCLFGYGVTAV